MNKRLGYTFKNASSKSRIVKILELLKSPNSLAEIAAATHIGTNNVRAYIKMLTEDEPRRVYVADWRKNSPGCPTPIYLLGDMPDKRRPKAMTSAQKSQKHRDKNPEMCLKDVQRKRLKRITVKRDPLTSAFFGRVG